MLTSEHPEPHLVLPETSTPTQSRIVSSIVPVSKHHAQLSTARVVTIDLRIGLNMLGIEGRKLLAEYIVTKRQERGNNQ